METTKNFQALKLKKVIITLSPLFALFFIFFLVKLGSPGIRLSDTNLYFYTGRELLQGKALYKDVFFTNLPLFPYISLFYGIITGWNLVLFYASSLVEVALISLLIYLAVREQTKSTFSSLIASSTYLFSFITLSTSDHQTGVFSASLFFLAGYILLQKSHYKLAGILLALSLLTKAYFLPVILSLMLFYLVKNKKSGIYVFVSFSGVFALATLFFYILSDGQIIDNIINYSLTRSEGISKIHILQFFAKKDLFLFTLLFLNITLFKKNLFYFASSVLSILFIIVYKDIYYLYLNFLTPVLCLSLGFWINQLKSRQTLVTSVVLLIIILMPFNIFSYIDGFKKLQRVEDPNMLVQKIQLAKPQYLYGINSITPALSHLSNVPLLDGKVDTNENLFRSGILNATSMSKKASLHNTVLVTTSAIYPGLHIEEILFSEIFDKNHLASCLLMYSQPVVSEGVANYISLLHCQN